LIIEIFPVADITVYWAQYMQEYRIFPVADITVYWADKTETII